ncbi:recombination protein RecR [bacterium]|nr:recombination protein RecR [bacterium]
MAEVSGHPLGPIAEQLSKLPGVGPKSALRMAFFLASMPQKEVDYFSSVIQDIRARVRYCDSCFTISLESQCPICANPRRDTSKLCVVAEPRDTYSMERTMGFSGVYHVLGGLISPLDGIHPEALRIPELLKRVSSGTVNEVILGINSTIEGEATILYLSGLLKQFPVKISKLAYGLPIGSDLEYADELTLQRALVARITIE